MTDDRHRWHTADLKAEGLQRGDILRDRSGDGRTMTVIGYREASMSTRRANCRVFVAVHKGRAGITQPTELHSCTLSELISRGVKKCTRTTNING